MAKAHHSPDAAITDPQLVGELSPFGHRAMLAEERRAAISSLRLISVLAAVMVPCFVILDIFAYPELVQRFVFLRILCTVGILVLFGLVHTRLAKRYFRVFTVLLPLIPATFIAIMVYETRDPGTPYYAGLSLCIVAIGFLFHWTYREALVVSVAVLLLYLFASSPSYLYGMSTRTAAGVVNNMFFLLAKGVVIVAGSAAHYRYRVREFKVRERLRHEKNHLRKQRQTLESTLNELQATEGQLIQSEKMASLGLLGAGVIHEIGNPLNYSNQALFLLRRTLPPEAKTPQIEETLDDMQESYDRINDIVKELRDFSQKSHEIDIDYEVSDSIASAVRMLRQEIEESGVRVELDLQPNLRIEAVKNQITQVLINLVHNAVHALEKSEKSDGREIRIQSFASDRLAQIVVRDNGPGIQHDSLKKIFDPFFTTKDPGVGTGLGLSICYRIIEAHSGEISVQSEPGVYSQFTVKLPLSRQEFASQGPNSDDFVAFPHEQAAI